MSHADEVRKELRDADPETIVGTLWRFRCKCGRVHERRGRYVPIGWYNEIAGLVRDVSDEVVLIPVATLNAISERAERAERESIPALKQRIRELERPVA